MGKKDCPKNQFTEENRYILSRSIFSILHEKYKKFYLILKNHRPVFKPL